MSDSFSITSPEDLINAVPFLLGFHPTRSVVVLSLRDDQRRVGLTVRLDYPEFDGDIAAIAQRLAMHLLDDGAAGAVLVIYRESGGPKDRLADAVALALHDHAIELHDALIVSSGRWWSLMEDDLPQGHPLPEFISSNVAATQVLNGTPLPMESDAELRESLGAVDTDFSRALGQACSIRRDQVNREAIVEGDGNRIRAIRQRHIGAGADAVDRVFTSWVAQSDVVNIPCDDLAAMLIGMRDVHVRDYAMGIHGDDQLELALSLWKAVLPLAPAGCIAPVATVLAAVAFESGDGVLAQRAIDCAFDDRLNYPMAALLRQAMESGWAPGAMTAMRKDLRAAVVATVRAA